MDIPAYLIHSSSKHPIGKAVGILRYIGKQFNQLYYYVYIGIINICKRMFIIICSMHARI